MATLSYPEISRRIRRVLAESGCTVQEAEICLNNIVREIKSSTLVQPPESVSSPTEPQAP